MNNAIPTIELSTEYSISRILKGGWQLAQGHSAVDKSNAVLDMFKFVEAGITTFDFGDIYTGVEELVGEFLVQYSKRFGKTRIRDIQLHTKFVPDLNSLSSITKRDVEKIIDRSLKRLGVEQLDLVQYHWWDFDVQRYVETAHHLMSLKKAGKIKNIGVTNFDVPRLKEIAESGVKIISSQNQYSLIDSRPEHGLVEYCKKNDIKLLCYGTVAGGFLSKKYLNLPEPVGQLENRSLVKYKLIIDDFGGWNLFQELLRVLQEIATKHNVSITNVASKYVLNKPQVAGIIIGARNADHVSDNKKVFEFILDENDSRKINAVLIKANGPQGDVYYLERIKGGKHASIMKYNLNKE